MPGISILRRGGGWTYRYDAQNRLTSASNGTHTALFHYDGKNRQVMRSIDGVVRFSAWDDWELLEEYDTNSVRTAAYLQGAHGVIKSLLNNIYYYQDKLGSTTHIADGSGNLLESYRYDLYGTPSYFNALNNPLSTTNYSVNDLYAGERWIPDLGMYDLRNRFMSPELGRFLQSDPIGFKGDASNLYRYCHNDPEDFSDPTGMVNTSADGSYSSLTSFGGGDWIKGSDGLSASDWNHKHDQAGMDGGAPNNGGEGAGRSKSISSENEGKKGALKTVIQDYKSLLKWVRLVESAAVMTSEFITGKGPAERVFSANSPESNDLRSDPKYEPALKRAMVSKDHTAHVDFGVRGLIAAGLHPTRQFVGSYDVGVNGKSAFTYNQTSVWSALGHAPFFSRSGQERPGSGGNTTQIYIMGRDPSE